MSTYHNSELGIGPTKNVLEHLEDLKIREKAHQQEINDLREKSGQPMTENQVKPIGLYLNTN